MSLLLTFLQYFSFNKLAILPASYLTGRHLISLFLMDLPAQDRKEYIKSNIELIFSVGLSHTVMTKLLNMGIEYATGFPQQMYADYTHKFLLLYYLLLISHMDLPKPGKKMNQFFSDPFAMTEDGIIWLMDAFYIGLKKQIPLLFDSSPSIIPWHKILTALNSFFDKNSVKTALNYFKKIILPEFLQNGKSALRDPIIYSNWVFLKEMLFEEIKIIKGKKDNNQILFLAGKVPSLAATFNRYLTGESPMITKLSFNLILNTYFNQIFDNIEINLKLMDGYYKTALHPLTRDYDLVPKPRTDESDHKLIEEKKQLTQQQADHNIKKLDNRSQNKLYWLDNRRSSRVNELDNSVAGNTESMRQVFLNG